MKKSIISFIVFCGIVALSRHIVNDIKQGERISVLENAVSELYLEIASNNEKIDTAYTQPESLAEQPRRSENKNPYIYNNVRTKERSTESTRITANKDTLKFTNPILLELNTVDSATLVRVPGIGAKSASMIISYRERMGGFYSPYQISERLTWDGANERMEEWCTKWFKADERFIKKLDINNADFKEILRHPYINYEQTKAIVNYRNKHKKIESINVLELFEEFQKEDIERLRHYLKFTE